MKFLIELSGECETLSASEAVGAASGLGGRPEVIMQDAGVLVMESGCSPDMLVKRLALSHHVSEWLGTVSLSGLESAARQIDVPGPVRVRATRVGDSHKGLDLCEVTRSVGGFVGRGKGVDLTSPRSDIRVIVSRELHFGRLLGSIDRSSFEARKNQNMPFKHPISLHPKYARALVNLVRVREGGTLLDPFCGTGAIVAECAISGFRAIGADVSEKMIAGARRNLDELGLSAELSVCDVGDIGSHFAEIDAIVTDPPYGRSTSTDGEELHNLFARAIRTFHTVLRGGSRVAIVLPDKSYLDMCSGFTVKEAHGLWVHRSLTRHFVLLEKN